MFYVRPVIQSAVFFIIHLVEMCSFQSSFHATNKTSLLSRSPFSKAGKILYTKDKATLQPLKVEVLSLKIENG